MKNAEAYLQESTWTMLACGPRRLALPSSAVVRSIVAPRPHSVPFAPKHIAGAAQVDGMILPCLSLGVLLGDHQSGQAQEALIVSHEDRQIIVLIDQALRQIDLGQTDRENLSVLEQHAETDGEEQAVLAELPHKDGSLFLLNPAALCRFSARQRQKGERPGLIAEVSTTAGNETTESGNLFLSVLIGGNRFAIPVGLCRELLALESVSSIPGAPPGILGLTQIREVSHLVVDTAGCLGIKETTNQQGVVVEQDSTVMVLAIDDVDSVRAVGSHHIRPVGTGKSLTESVLEEPGQPLCAVLSIAALRDCLPDIERYLPEQRSTAEDEALKTVSFLLLLWGEERFAIPLASIERLIPIQKVKRTEAEHLDGIISVEGEVLPVLAARYFYGIDDNGDEREGFVIVHHRSDRYAIALAASEGIIHVPENQIDRSQSSESRFSATIRHDQSLISVMAMNEFSNVASDLGDDAS